MKKFFFGYCALVASALAASGASFFGDHQVSVERENYFTAAGNGIRVSYGIFDPIVGKEVSDSENFPLEQAANVQVSEVKTHNGMVAWTYSRSVPSPFSTRTVDLHTRTYSAAENRWLRTSHRLTSSNSAVITDFIIGDGIAAWTYVRNPTFPNSPTQRNIIATIYDS